MITLQDVHKQLAGQAVLNGVDLEIERGETMVIIGRSGSGKSVTIKHMVVLLRPDRGSIIIDGVDVAALDETGIFNLRSASTRT